MTFEEWWEKNDGEPLSAYTQPCFSEEESYTFMEVVARERAAWEEAYKQGHMRGVSDTLSMFSDGVPEDMKPIKEKKE